MSFIQNQRLDSQWLCVRIDRYSIHGLSTIQRLKHSKMKTFLDKSDLEGQAVCAPWEDRPPFNFCNSPETQCFCPTPFDSRRIDRPHGRTVHQYAFQRNTKTHCFCPKFSREGQTVCLGLDCPPLTVSSRFSNLVSHFSNKVNPHACNLDVWAKCHYRTVKQRHNNPS